MSLNGIDENSDLIQIFWQRMEKRTTEVLELRQSGHTLEEIGRRLALTRERVRQIEAEGRDFLKFFILRLHPDLPEKLNEALESGGIVELRVAAKISGTASLSGIRAFLEAGGYKPFQLWRRKFPDWWVKNLRPLSDSFNQLVSCAPIKSENLLAHAAAIGIPANFPVEEALSSPGSPLIRDRRSGWIRRSSKSADSAYLWLSDRVEPAKAEEMAAAIGAVSARALTEVLRRNSSRFVQVRPEGTWALKEWNHVAGAHSYRDATEAVLAVLQELGPLNEQQLSAETIRRYPVTPWRIAQCLYSSSVGQTPDGRYDLVSRGALPLKQEDASLPGYMAESGSTIAVKLTVTDDLLRGSGLGVNSWLTWRLNLHNYPAELRFQTDRENCVTVRRQSSGSSISSLRRYAAELGLMKGCLIIVIFNTAGMTATIRHGCTPACSNDIR